MVQPIDYTLDVLSPFQAAVGGLQAGLGIRETQQNMELAQAQEGRAEEEFGMRRQEFDQQQAMIAERQARAQAAQTALVELAEAESPTAQDYGRFITQFPEFAQEAQQAYELMDGDRRQSVLREALQVYTALDSGNVEAARAVLEQRKAAAENSGDVEGAASADANLRLLEINPDAMKTTLGLQIKSVGGDDYDEILERPRVQSSVAIGNGRILVQSMSKGPPRVVKSSTGEQLFGQEAEDAIDEAEKAQAQQREAEAFGRGVGAETVKIGREALDGLASARSEIRLIDEAIGEIDAGAKSGAIAKYFPNVTQASASLENAMNRLGLNVISSVTFGALSEGEMRLAMETAVPRNLGPQALRAWFVEKRRVQALAAQALQNAANTLLVEGDLSGYIQSQSVDTAPEPATQAAPQAPAGTGYTGGGGRNAPRTAPDLSEIERGITELERMLGGGQ